MLTIDVQVHAYERDRPGRPWAAVLHGPAEVTGEDMIKAMDAVGVDGLSTCRSDVVQAGYLLLSLRRAAAEDEERNDQGQSSHGFP